MYLVVKGIKLLNSLTTLAIRLYNIEKWLSSPYNNMILSNDIEICNYISEANYV